MDKKENYLNYRRRFHEKYVKIINPLLEKYNQERIAMLNVAYKIALPVAFVLAIVMLFILPTNMKPAPFLLIGVGFWLYFKNYAQELSKKINQEVAPKIFNCFENIERKKGVYVNHLDLFDSLVVLKPNKYTIDEVSLGRYRDISYEIFDIKLDYIDRLSKKKQVKTSNKTVIKFKINKEFNSHTIIMPAELLHNSPKAGLKYLKINGNVFPKEVDVFTNDELEAKSLISALFVKFLVSDVLKYFKSNEIKCSFYKSTFYLAIENNRKDECQINSVNKNVNESVSFAQMFDMILIVYKLIDFLNE